MGAWLLRFCRRGRSLTICMRITSARALFFSTQFNSSIMATGSRATTMTFPELPDHPSQPTATVFPRRPFGKTKVVHRSFQSVWFNQWKWLHYDASNDRIYCFICLKAIQSGNWLVKLLKVSSCCFARIS